MVPDLIILAGTLGAIWMIRSWMIELGLLRTGLAVTAGILTVVPPMAYVLMRVADRTLSTRYPIEGTLSNLGLLLFVLPMLVLTKLPSMGSTGGILLIALTVVVAGFTLRSGAARFDDNPAEAGRESRLAILRTAGVFWIVAGVLLIPLGMVMPGLPGGGGLAVPVLLVLLLTVLPAAGIALAVARLRA